MNSLTSCKMFELLDQRFKIIPKVKSIDLWMPKFEAPREQIDPLIAVISRHKKDLCREIVIALKKGQVRFFISEEPLDPSKQKPIELPSTISALAVNTKKAGVVSYVDLSAKATYERNKTDPSIINMLDIDENYFYAYALRGYINHALVTDRSHFEMSFAFQKAVTTAYAKMVGKIISAMYGTGAIASASDRLSYILRCFAYENFFNVAPEDAMKRALAKGQTLNDLMNTSVFYNRLAMDPRFDMRSNTNRSTWKLTDYDRDAKEGEKVYPIDVLMAALRTEFKEMNSINRLSVRMITSKFYEVYGGNALLALEHCESFVQMLLTANLKCAFYKDQAIIKLCDTDIKVILDTFKVQ